jgi:hypothetical protein
MRKLSKTQQRTRFSDHQGYMRAIYRVIHSNALLPVIGYWEHKENFTYEPDYVIKSEFGGDFNIEIIKVDTSNRKNIGYFTSLLIYFLWRTEKGLRSHAHSRWVRWQINNLINRLVKRSQEK